MTVIEDQANRVWVGYAAEPGEPAGDGVNYLEVQTTFHNLPKPQTARKWAKKREAGVSCGLVAWQVITHRPGAKGYPRLTAPLPQDALQSAGHFRATDVVASATDRLAETSSAAQSSVLVFRTGADFSPSAQNRDALQRYFRELRSRPGLQDLTLVWSPEGVWELEEAVALVAEHGVICACDPVSRDPLDTFDYTSLPGGKAYFRVRAVGERKLKPAALDVLTELIAFYPECWVVFDTNTGYRDARGFAALLA